MKKKPHANIKIKNNIVVYRNAPRHTILMVKENYFFTVLMNIDNFITIKNAYI